MGLLSGKGPSLASRTVHGAVTRKQTTQAGEGPYPQEYLLALPLPTALATTKRAHLFLDDHPLDDLFLDDHIRGDL